MRNFQQRFIFYVTRSYNLMDNPEFQEAELRPYTAREISMAASILFEMCFTNHIAKLEDEHGKQLVYDIDEIHEAKISEYTEEISEVVKRVILGADDIDIDF